MDRQTLAVYCPPVSSTAATPAEPLVMNNSRIQAMAENLPRHEPLVLAENDPADATAMPAGSEGSEMAVQLPPLHYASPAGPPLPLMVRHHHRDNMVASAPDSMPTHRDGPRGFGATVVEHPASPAPRFDNFNSPGRQMEPPRVAMESRPAQAEYRAAPAEYRPAPAEPARAAPAPAPPPSVSTSKSGK
jgi:hypothetical protein